MLAYLRNCSYRNFGIKVTNVYFPVDMELLLNFTICVELSRTFLVVACTCWLGIVLLGEFEEFGRNLENKHVLIVGRKWLWAVEK